MKNIQPALRHQLQSLHGLLCALGNEVYTYNSPLMSGATIGQHVRHTIELLQCLINGYEQGIVNYDNRKRDKRIETDETHAARAIENLVPLLVKADKDMLLEGCYGDASLETSKAVTTYKRELVYNIEHIIHHMALIKVGLYEQGIELANEDFGVAYATIQYRKQCVQ